MAVPKLRARGVCLDYRTRSTGRVAALLDVNLDIYPEEFVCIVGTSGCGKTTFLNAVDGLVQITRGTLTLDERPISKPGPDRAVVFQAPLLLPWRSVRGNVMYGLELQRVRREKARERADYFINLVGLDGFADAYPSQLSGGMQQRVNLARALATDPEILLLDEPFAALDAQTREFMQAELLKIWTKTRKTALFITHQIDEAVFLADRVVVFTARPGRVREVIRIDLPRPRTLAIKRTPDFMVYCDRIWGLIEEEAARAGFLRVADQEVVPV